MIQITFKDRKREDEFIQTLIEDAMEEELLEKVEIKQFLEV